MRFKLSLFKEQNKIELEFKEPTRNFNLEQDEYLQFDDYIQFKGLAEKINYKYLVSGEVILTFTGTCSRCLDEFKKDHSIKFNFLYVKKDSHSGIIDETQEAYYFGNEIKIDNEVRDQIILNLPTKLLCKEDCLGLCPICGRNRNHGDCKCKPEVVSKKKETSGQTQNLGELIKQNLKGGK